MRGLLFKFIGVIVLVASFAGGWVLLDYRSFLRSPLDTGPDGFVHVVLPGTSLSLLARQLQSRGILENPRYLTWLARWTGQANSIQAGEYEIHPGTRPTELLDQLVAGKTKQYTLTIVEGSTVGQILAALNEHEALQRTLNDTESLMEQLGRPGLHPEGWLYPETYRFPRGTRDIDFLKRAFTAMEQYLEREWENRDPDLPLKTPYEALILASIVEKETAVPEERSRIAGVFIRRLKRGMRLQTDPTVIYGMGLDFDGNIRSRDLRRDTPYNTYTRAGLPPTPIAIPSPEAIRAALHPAEGDEIYFVSKGDGSHAFSATLEQHNQAVLQYQLGGKRKSASSQ